MPTPIIFLIDHPLVRYTGMYMFDLQLAAQSAVQSANCSADSDQTCTFQYIIYQRAIHKKVRSS